MLLPSNGSNNLLLHHGNSFATDFDYLWLHAADRIGALAFGQSTRAPVEEKPLLEWAQLEQSVLLDAIQNIDRDLPLTPAEEEAALAFGAGTSAGGARPKLSDRISFRWTVTGDQDRRELFRRVAFNSLVSVTDDHERNHALVAKHEHFRLSPAFDLVSRPGNTRRRYLALAVGDFGALAARQNIISSVGAFGLSLGEANGIIDEVQEIVRANWRKSCTDRGVGDTDVARIEGCFDPPFFESELLPNAVM
jgi:hypothetical protein